MNSTFEYGPIYLDSQELFAVYLDVSCPQDIAEEVESGDDSRLLRYYRGLGFLLPREYFVGGRIEIEGQSLSISYETYQQMFKDANIYSW